jgi:hypothetical protein
LWRFDVKFGRKRRGQSHRLHHFMGGRPDPRAAGGKNFMRWEQEIKNKKEAFASRM